MKRRVSFGDGLKDKRYRRTEEAIIEVLLKSREMPSTRELTRKARISRSTLYRHHRAMPAIIPDYEKEILRRYRRIIRKLSRQRSIELKRVYLRTLFFIMRYKRVFRILFQHEGGRVVEKMVMELQGKIMVACSLPKNSEMTIRIYAKEVTGVVEEWGEGKFAEEEITRVLGDIMYLTETMRQRLGVLRK